MDREISSKREKSIKIDKKNLKQGMAIIILLGLIIAVPVAGFFYVKDRENQNINYTQVGEIKTCVYELKEKISVEDAYFLIDSVEIGNEQTDIVDNQQILIVNYETKEQVNDKKVDKDQLQRELAESTNVYLKTETGQYIQPIQPSFMKNQWKWAKEYIEDEGFSNELEYTKGKLVFVVPSGEKYVLSVCKYKEEKQGKIAYEIDEIPLEMEVK